MQSAHFSYFVWHTYVPLLECIQHTTHDSQPLHSTAFPWIGFLVSTCPPCALLVVQAKWSSIDFDYLSYAKLRWGEYFRRRDEFLAQAATAFAS